MDGLAVFIIIALTIYLVYIIAFGIGCWYMGNKFLKFMERLEKEEL